MKQLKVLLLALITTSLVSCGSTGNVVKTTSKSYTPTEVNSIEIFTSTTPEKPYFEIGTVSVKRLESRMVPIKRSAEKIMVDMKTKASSIGGHAIINYKESGEMNMTGTVIRYKE
jgi:hypothetical protein